MTSNEKRQFMTEEYIKRIEKIKRENKSQPNIIISKSSDLLEIIKNNDRIPAGVVESVSKKLLTIKPDSPIFKEVFEGKLEGIEEENDFD